MARDTGPADTFILYMAGHGIVSQPGNHFLFLPSDVRDTSSFNALRHRERHFGRVDGAPPGAAARGGEREDEEQRGGPMRHGMRTVVHFSSVR